MIYWESLLHCSEQDVCKTLETLYGKFSLEGLAAYLGVGYASMVRKLQSCKIKIRGVGGAHYKYPQEQLPFELSPEDFARATGYTINYSRYLISRHKKSKEVKK